jgi:hypothetical protein
MVNPTKLTEAEQPQWRGKNIFQRLMAIESELGALVKDGKAPSTIGNFMFHSHTAVTAILAPKLQEWNVLMVPSVREAEEREVDMGADSSGKKKMFHKSAVKVDILFRCPDMKHDEKDNALGISGYGTGIDMQDKAAGKAISYAIKTALLKAFKLDRTPGSGEVDNEADDKLGLDF